MYSEITTLPVLSNKEVMSLYRDGLTKETREKIILHNIRMVFNIAHKYGHGLSCRF